MSAGAGAEKSCRHVEMALLLLVSALIKPIMASADGHILNDLGPLEWENRIIVGETRTDKSNWLRQLHAGNEEIVDRHIIWFVLSGDSLSTNYPGTVGDSLPQLLRSQYLDGVTPRVVLIGKDGGVKRRAATLDLADLFGRIDLMPMRQNEMRNR